MSFSNYALLYSSVDVQQVVDSNVDLFITEGGAETNFANSAITQAELTTLQAAGTQVAGYINMSVTDDSRPYWDATWTDDGTDTGTVTALAPDWLSDQPSNEFGFVVDYTDTAWQDIVIAQAVDLVISGFDGVFMDDFQQYYVDAATGLTTSENATAMMEFAVRIDDAITAVNPDAVLISNGNPYVVTDGVGGATSTATTNYLDSIDGMLLEIFFGITQTETAAIVQASDYILGSADVLALEYGGTPYQNFLVQQAAEKVGFQSFFSSDASYSDFGDVTDATSGADDLLGTGLGDFIKSFAGDDTIDAGTGVDIVAGGVGADTMDGGAGSDYLNYTNSTAGVIIDMVTGTGTGGDADGDIFTAFENVVGSSFDDVITGDGSNNIIKGNGGADALDGGAGVDYLSYSNSSEGVSVNLDAGTGTGGDADDDVITGFERIVGSNFDDALSGDAASNLLIGGAGADALDGGAGTDWASYRSSAEAVTIDLAAGTGVGGDADGDTLANIERVIGSENFDFLTGDGANNKFVGGNGSDTIDGGAGDDVAVYLGDISGFTYENTAAGAWTVSETSTGYFDTLTNIETLQFNDGVTVEDAFLV